MLRVWLAVRHWTSLVCMPPWQEREHWGDPSYQIRPLLCPRLLLNPRPPPPLKRVGVLSWSIMKPHVEGAHLSSWSRK